MNPCRAFVVGTAALMLLGACGDSDESSNSSAATPGAEAQAVPPELAPYCAHVAEINASDPPTVEQFKRYQELAPAAIQDDVAIAAPAFIRALEAGKPETALSDPKVREASDAIQAFEQETCGGEDGGG